MIRFAFSHYDFGTHVFEEAQGDAADASVYTPAFQLGRDYTNGLWSRFPISKKIKLRKIAGTANKKNDTGLEQMQFQWSEDVAFWLSYCKKIQEKIESGAFQKIVPARYRWARVGVEAKCLQENMMRVVESGPDESAYKFYLESEGALFFGATPEILFLRKAGRIHIPAIAGTSWLGSGEELLHSIKERKEHQIVVEGIEAALRGLGLMPTTPKEPVILKYGKIQHLYTPIVAEDRPELNLSDEAIMNVLHPTPAISGLPKAAATEFIIKEEGWERGLYSSPILVQLPKDNYSFCLVAIRSALLLGDRLYQFAGAGYVQGSNPMREWEETGAKMDAALRFFMKDKNGIKR